MTDNAPGWQTDPTGRHDHRYWDGSQWTEHVSDAGVATTDPYEAPAPAPTPPEAPAPAPTEAAAAEAPAATDPPSTPSAWSTSASAEEPAAPGTAEEADQAEAADTIESADTVEAADTVEDATVEDATVVAPAVADTASSAPPSSYGWSSPAGSTPSEPQAAPDAPAEPEVPAEPDATTELDPTDVPLSYTSPLLPIGHEPAPADEPTVVDALAVDPDAPAVDPEAPGSDQTVVDDITTTWPVDPGLADAPPPPVFTPPPVGDDAGGDGGGDGSSKRMLLIGLGVLAIIAIVIGAMTLGGGDDEDLESRIASEMREGGQSGLDQREAECLAGELIDDLGEDKLDGVDFSADNPPEAIADELNQAFVDAIPTCDIDLSDEGDATDDGATTTTAAGDGSTDTSLSAEQVDEFRDLLAEQYRTTLGLSEEQSDCLATTMADAIEAGELDEQDSFDQFFEYLDACDISVSDLGGASGVGTTGNG